MARCLQHILKSMCKSKSALFAYHFQHPCDPSLIPANVFPSFPFPTHLSSILMFNVFSQDIDSAVVLRTISSPCYATDYVQTVAEDFDGSPVLIRIYPAALLPENTFLAVRNPAFELIGESVGFDVAAEKVTVLGEKDQVPTCFRAEYLLKAVKEMIEDKKTELALSLSLKGIQTYPGDVALLIQVAECHKTLHNYDQMLLSATKVLTLSPTNFPAQLLLAEALFSLRQFEEAESVLSFLISEYPNDPHIPIVQKQLTNLRKVKKSRESDMMNSTRLLRLKELVLVEWPRQVTLEKIKAMLEARGVGLERISISGKTAILYFLTVERREDARVRLTEMESDEFVLANAPVTEE